MRLSPSLLWRRPFAVALALAIALPAFAFGIHALLGHARLLAPADAALPASAVLTQEDMPYAKDMLARHLARNPRDGRGWVLHARNEFDGGRYAAAAAAYRKALDASANVARDPGVWCEYADALALAQGGVLAGLPRELIERALAIDPRHATALEMAGSAAFEAGDFDMAVRHWRQLRAQMPDDTPQRRDLGIAIGAAERRGLVRETAPVVAR